MLKLFSITALLICVLVDVDAGTRSCTSCGSECAPACGTRRFRTCCFNYLRRKRGPEIEYIPDYFENYATSNALLFNEEPERSTELFTRDIPNSRPNIMLE